MALSSTIYTFNINLADVDRSVYETLDMRVAQHPTETLEYMFTRVLAYCLEYEEGMAFGQSIGTLGGEEPAVWAKDYTGAIKVWVEVGHPDPDKLHRASKAALRTCVYTNRNWHTLRGNLLGNKIYDIANIPFYVVEKVFLSELIGVVERRMDVNLSVSEGQIYLDANGRSWQTQLEKHFLDG